MNPRIINIPLEEEYFIRKDRNVLTQNNGNSEVISSSIHWLMDIYIEANNWYTNIYDLKTKNQEGKYGIGYRILTVF